MSDEECGHENLYDEIGDRGEPIVICYDCCEVLD